MALRTGDNSTNSWEPVVIRRKGRRKAGGSQAGGGNRPPKGMDEATTTFKTQKTTSSYRKAIQNARIARNWTQKQLAQQMNVQTTAVQKWESGKEVPPGNLRGKLNRVLKTKLPKIKRVQNRGDAEN